MVRILTITILALALYASARAQTTSQSQPDRARVHATAPVDKELGDGQPTGRRPIPDYRPEPGGVHSYDFGLKRD